MSNRVLDYKSILEKCGVGSASSPLVVKNIAGLEEFYDAKELVEIYNYCLQNISDPDILINVISFSNDYKSVSTMNILLDMLVNKRTADNIENDAIINLRVMCAKAISNYKDNSALGVLLYCLNNKNENYKIRLACADALGRIGDQYAVEPLINVLKDEEEKSVYLKETATTALGMLGDTSAIDPLISILESKQAFLDKFTFLKEKIVEALGKLNINNKKVIKALKISLMDSSPIVRINAIEAIMNSEDEESYDLIKPSLLDEDEEVRKNALIALYNINGKEILNEVVNGDYPDSLKDEALELINEYEAADE